MTASYGTSKHDDACTCAHCEGFQPGNTISLKHGAYSTVHLGKRAAQLAAEIRDTAPVYEDADEPAVRLLALTLARVEAAAKAIDRMDELADGGSPLAAYQSQLYDSLRRDLRGWIGTSMRLAAELGLTPLSRGRLGVSVAQIRTEQSRQQLLAKYGGNRAA
jgi:hypothetical protein